MITKYKTLAVAVSTSVFFNTANASDVDYMLAKTSLALGDEYSKIANEYQSQYFDSKESTTDEEEQVELKKFYKEYKELAQLEYENIFCEITVESDNRCSSLTGGLQLEAKYNYLRREAFSKYDLLESGSNVYGKVAKHATIYAVNGNFEDHLLGRINNLVDKQTQFDSEARNLKNKLSQFDSAYIDNNEEIQGVDQALLRESNYTNNEQSQLSTYNSCVESYNAEDKFESDEYSKATQQFKMLQANIKNNFDKVYDQTVADLSGNKAIKVEANLAWQDTEIEFSQGDRAYITSSGKWVIRGAVQNFKSGDIYTNTSQTLNNQSLGFSFKKIIKIATTVTKWMSPIGPLEMAVKLLDKSVLKQADLVEQHVEQSAKPAFYRISTGTLEADGKGYYLSFSHSTSKSSNRGKSKGVNAGVSFLFGSIGGSRGSSKGQSLSNSSGIGGTSGLKLETTVLNEAPVGALIGSFCAVDPATDVACEVFQIGETSVVPVLDELRSRKLWLRANDNPTVFSENIGHLNVEIKKATTFAAYIEEYLLWLGQDCNDDGEDCGFIAFIENIAYTPSPFLTAKSMFKKKFPHFPSEVQEVLLDEINYLVELQVVGRDLKSKELSQELNDVKTISCQEQIEYSTKILENTKNLVATYTKSYQSKKIKRLLIDTGRKFYEEELANINVVREKNLERIKRYYDLTINSYNYLYLDTFKSSGDQRPYYEGQYYKDNIALMEDLILEITAVNDLLNPNRGFVVYELSEDELAPLLDKKFKNRKTQVRLDMNEFLCKGFSFNDQARVMIDKVGVLLDIDPVKEHLFFKNRHVRGTKVSMVHGAENRFFDFSGNEVEFWMPAQRRKISAMSSRVLVDANSDYTELRESRHFDRTSFRKTSFSSTWRLEMKDAGIRMYEDSDTSLSNPLLKGVKLVLWYNSTDLQQDEPINSCLMAPYDITVDGIQLHDYKAKVSWSFDPTDDDFDKASRFQVYRSTSESKGYKKIGYVEKDSVSCEQVDGDMKCEFLDLSATNFKQKKLYYKIRSAYLKDETSDTFMSGVMSEQASITTP